LHEYSGELKKTKKWVKDFDHEKQLVFESWKKKYAKDGKIMLYHAVGCTLCNEGYKGRVGLYEMMSASDAIKVAIKKRVSLEDLVELCLEEGMETLKMDGVLKVLAGDTDLKQVLIVCMK
jgi:type II secretory ATPase GspE/PulE/Tfp pilus assembly ATPase PilB-like protein